MKKYLKLTPNNYKGLAVLASIYYNQEIYDEAVTFTMTAKKCS